MTHVRQKLALCLVCRFRLEFRFFELFGISYQLTVQPPNLTGYVSAPLTEFFGRFRSNGDVHIGPIDVCDLEDFQFPVHRPSFNSG